MSDGQVDIYFGENSPYDEEVIEHIFDDDTFTRIPYIGEHIFITVQPDGHRATRYRVRVFDVEWDLDMCWVSILTDTPEETGSRDES